jgi:hypothetical protein
MDGKLEGDGIYFLAACRVTIRDRSVHAAGGPDMPGRPPAARAEER